jgi:hypothetical protein
MLNLILNNENAFEKHSLTLLSLAFIKILSPFILLAYQILSQPISIK